MADIYTLLPKAAALVAAVGRDRRADAAAGGFAYRGVDDLLDAVHGPLSETGITYWPTIVDVRVDTITTSNNRAMRLATVTVDQTFAAPDGSAITVRMVGEGADSLDKSIAKAITAALKSTLIAVFTIPASDLADVDAPTAGEISRPTDRPASSNPPTSPTPGQVANIEKWIADHGLSGWADPFVAAVLLAEPSALREHGHTAPLNVWWRDNAGTPAKFKAAVEAEIEGSTGAVPAGA